MINAQDAQPGQTLIPTVDGEPARFHKPWRVRKVHHRVPGVLPLSSEFGRPAVGKVWIEMEKGPTWVIDSHAKVAVR